MKTRISPRSPILQSAAMALLAAGSVLGAASTALAQEAARASDEIVAVSYADLDLNSRGGAQTMFDRIQTAAIRACERPPEGVGQLNAWIEERDCQQAKVDELVAKLNAPLVTALDQHASAVVARR